MTTAPPESPVIEGLRSLEVRWILPGPLEPAVAGWFGRFPTEIAARQDAYLLNPERRGLSVKVRAGTALEVKVYHGSPGTLEIASPARGRLEAWQKWSFPVAMLSQASRRLPDWTVVRKTRRITRFRLANGRIIAAVPGSATELGCAVELTEIHVGSQAWWSLGFEATGPIDLIRSTLERAAALIFSQALPGDVELGLSQCRSYAEWLSCHVPQ